MRIRNQRFAWQIVTLVADADRIKESAQQAVAELREHSNDIQMITGDNERTVRAVVEQIGIESENANAEVLTDAKEGIR